MFFSVNMLFLLRNIRRNLMQNKKRGTYLLYAIGEITLVVLGILIAVKIDNLNQDRLDRELERQLLTEMLGDLSSQAQDIKSNIDEHQDAFIACNILRKFLLEDFDYHDSLAIYFTQAFYYTVLSNKQGAYKALENNGLMLI